MPFAIVDCLCLCSHRRQQIHLRGIHSTLCQQQKLKTIEERAGLPTKPKRPLSGYLRFVKEHSAPVKETNPQLSHRECLLHIGKMWNSISLTQKEEYSKPYKDEKSNYLAQMIVYNRSLTEDDKRSIREARAKIVARRAELTRSKQRRELGKPKKPANGYLKFRAERLRSRDLVDGKQTKEEFCKYIRESNNDWRALSDAERARYKTTPAELEEYK